MAAQVAQPMTQTKKITMVSSGKGDVGAAKLTGEIIEIMTKMPTLIHSISGIDISKVGLYYKPNKSSHWYRININIAITIFWQSIKAVWGARINCFMCVTRELWKYDT